MPDSVFRNAYQDGIATAKSCLLSMIEEIQKFGAQLWKEIASSKSQQFSKDFIQ
jgi:hypothetical protein